MPILSFILSHMWLVHIPWRVRRIFLIFMFNHFQCFHPRATTLTSLLPNLRLRTLKSSYTYHLTKDNLVDFQIRV